MALPILPTPEGWKALVGPRRAPGKTPELGLNLEPLSLETEALAIRLRRPVYYILTSGGVYRSPRHSPATWSLDWTAPSADRIWKEAGIGALLQHLFHQLLLPPLLLRLLLLQIRHRNN